MPADVTLRCPRVADGKYLWGLARHTGVLDVNSPYAYLLIGAHFAPTSIVAHQQGSVVGFISGYRVPEREDVLFVWQVGVSESARGQGIASRMLDALVRQAGCAGVRFVETTVSPSNRPSRAMFESFARRLGTSIAETTGFAIELFPAAHEEERLLRIGPFDAPAVGER